MPQSILVLSPDHPEALFQLGELCYRSGEWFPIGFSLNDDAGKPRVLFGKDPASLLGAK